MEELRDEIYTWSLGLMRGGKEMEGIFLLLATWNFAYFRYHMKKFQLEEFKAAVKECDFDYFKDKDFVNANFDDEEVKARIIEIYKKLSSFEGIKFVGASKIMHLKNPKFFMMWDRKIIKNYQAKNPEIKTTPEGYFNFMKLMQDHYKKGLLKGLTEGVSVPRAIDLYNMENC